jgi:hypothetical protein
MKADLNAISVFASFSSIFFAEPKDGARSFTCLGLEPSEHRNAWRFAGFFHEISDGDSFVIIGIA